MSARSSHEAIRLAVALDFPELTQAEALLERLQARPATPPIIAKVGLELFSAMGPEGVNRLHSRFGVEIFLDLKLHDIPNTVRSAVARIARIPGVKYATLHCGGGVEMLRAAQLAASGTELRLLGVTVLTSFTEQTWADVGQRIGSSSRPIGESVQELTGWAAAAGLWGVVCSPLEIESVRSHFPGLSTVVPGIRPEGSDRGDQARTLTPKQAAMARANMIVVGRPITQAADPGSVVEKILQEISS